MINSNVDPSPLTTFHLLQAAREAEWSAWQIKIDEELPEIAERISSRVVAQIFDYFLRSISNPTVLIPYKDAPAKFRIDFSFRDAIEKSFFWNCLQKESIFFTIRDIIEKNVNAVNSHSSGQEKVAIEQNDLNQEVNCQPRYVTNYAQLDRLFHKIAVVAQSNIESKIHQQSKENKMPMEFQASVCGTIAEDSFSSKQSSKSSRNYGISLGINCWIAEQKKQSTSWF